MVLEATSTEAGVKRYLVVGTSVNRGEDMSSKGNVSASCTRVREPDLTDRNLARNCVLDICVRDYRGDRRSRSEWVEAPSNIHRGSQGTGQCACECRTVYGTSHGAKGEP
jgi:hypothetical protein